VNLHCETEDAGVMLIGALLLHELRNGLEKKEERKRTWVVKWIRRRNLYGASNILLKRESIRLREASQNESGEV
jgi:hypothetical protein